MEQKKRRGRPPKVAQEPKPMPTLTEACQVIMREVLQLKDVYISFDHEDLHVCVMWYDEQYKARPNEVAEVIEAIKYLKSMQGGIEW